MPVAIIGNYNHGNFAAEYFFHAPVEAFGVAFQLVEAAVINDSGVTIIRVAYVHDFVPLEFGSDSASTAKTAHKRKPAQPDAGGLQLSSIPVVPIALRC